MGGFKLLWVLLSLVNKLLAQFGKWSLRRQHRNEFQNEQIAQQVEIARRAEKVRRAVRRFDAEHPDRRLQDDGYRRD